MANIYLRNLHNVYHNSTHMPTALNLKLGCLDIDLNFPEYAAEIERIRNIPTPNFAKYEPDLENLRSIRKKYKNARNLIVEGNGGAIENFRGIFGALSHKTKKKVYMLDTEDPDYIFEVTKNCDKKNTLVVLTSKSGTRIQVIANYFALKKYPILVITEDNNGTLNEIRKIKNHYSAFYPSVSMTDRFTGLTESALVTAEIVGINTALLVTGGRDMHQICGPSSNFEHNIALKFAITLDKLEKLGYYNMFLSIYSKKLGAFYNLLSQLFHESVCKNGLGQTIYGGEAPENQHHTLQRFISGRKDSIGIFITVSNFSHKNIIIKTDKDLNGIVCRNITLEKLNNISLADIIRAEFEGTWQDVVDNKIPAINIEIDELSEYSVGAFMAFFQYTAFYSAILRGVNPCDQPGVEKSKENIFKIIDSFT